MVRQNPRIDYEVLTRFRTGVWAVQPETGQIYAPGERRMLKTWAQPGGYLHISVPPLSSRYPLSRAVWIGATLTVPVFDDLEVDHINGNKLDNRFKNLRLLTHAGNGHCSGKQIPFEQAEAIRREYKQGGVTLKELAERYGRSTTSVRLIVRGKTYTKIPAVSKNTGTGRQLDDKLRYGVFKELCIEGKQAKSVMQKYKITRETLRTIIEEQSLLAKRIPDAAEPETEAEAAA